jgi:hypothetical protein
MSFKLDHPEQDPAEGSRKVIDRELARQRQQTHSLEEREQRADSEAMRKPVHQEHRPM